MMTELSQSWNWFEVFKAAIGPTIAAIFLVIGIWLKEWYDRRKAAQSWFEQYYITEGLDVLISHVSALRTELVNTKFALFTRPTAPNRLPFEVAARVQTLLNNDSLNNAYDIAHKSTMDIIEELESGESAELSKLNTRKVDALSATVLQLHSNLQQIRKQLLRVNIKNKAEVYRIAKHKDIAPLIKGSHDEVMKGMAEVKDIYELQAAGAGSAE